MYDGKAYSLLVYKCGVLVMEVIVTDIAAKTEAKHKGGTLEGGIRGSFRTKFFVNFYMLEGNRKNYSEFYSAKLLRAAVDKGKANDDNLEYVYKTIFI